jgi:hypothetical protein
MAPERLSCSHYIFGEHREAAPVLLILSRLLHSSFTLAYIESVPVLSTPRISMEGLRVATQMATEPTPNRFQIPSLASIHRSEIRQL